MNEGAETRKPKRAYGRHPKGWKHRTVSLDADLAQWLEEDAAKRGVSVSARVNTLLECLRAAEIERGVAQ